MWGANLLLLPEGDSYCAVTMTTYFRHAKLFRVIFLIQVYHTVTSSNSLTITEFHLSFMVFVLSSLHGFLVKKN